MSTLRQMGASCNYVRSIVVYARLNCEIFGKMASFRLVLPKEPILFPKAKDKQAIQANHRILDIDMIKCILS
jgi:hypothetical protein